MPDLLDQLWELDKENSFTRITVTPIRNGDEVYYRYDSECQIRPYPNPFSFGGFWGSGFAKTEEEVNQRIETNRDYLAEWLKRGLSFEVIRKPMVTLTEDERERHEKAREALRQLHPEHQKQLRLKARRKKPDQLCLKIE